MWAALAAVKGLGVLQDALTVTRNPTSEPWPDAMCRYPLRNHSVHDPMGRFLSFCRNFKPGKCQRLQNGACTADRLIQCLLGARSAAA